MLLRSSSSLINNSWVVALSRDPFPSDATTDAVRLLRHSRSVTHLSSLPHLSASSSHYLSSAAHLHSDGFRPRIAGNLSDFSWSDVEEAGEEDAHVAESHSVNRFLSCSGLDETPELEDVLSPEVDGAEGSEEDWLKKGSKDGGAIDVNFSGSGFGENDGSGGFCNGGSGEIEQGFDLDSRATDAKYRQMIEADPSNSLLLRNYAKFLHEVEGDVDRAEEYYGRAMVADPFDGDILSHYATLLWKERRDYALADALFSRAIKASPSNCFVLGSYAYFLWELGEAEEGKRFLEKDGSNSSVHSDSARLEEGAASMPIAASG